MDSQKAPKTIFIQLGVTSTICLAVEFAKTLKQFGAWRKIVFVLPQDISMDDKYNLQMVSDQLLILSEKLSLKNYMKKGDIVVSVDEHDEPAKEAVSPPVAEAIEEDIASSVAVVGMAIRFPQANTVEEYWNILKTGAVTATAPPLERVAVEDSSICGNFLGCPIDEFDAAFFGISHGEAMFVDPQARLVLETCWEAFEDANINPEEFRETEVFTYYSSWILHYLDALNLEFSRPGRDILRKYLGNGLGATGARLPYFYGFTGRSLSVDSGCSSTGVGVQLAVKSLQTGECPLAVVAGANIILHMGLQPHVLASDGKCRSFSDQADGYGRAEGVAVLLLKRYQDAIKSGDNIHGIIRGVGCAQEGPTKSFGTPTPGIECLAMRRALQNAGIHPNQVDFVEAHATGTAVGDPIEAAAISLAYSSSTARESPLLVGSGKANIGHTEACAGIAGMIKVMLSMRHEVIPKQVSLDRLNPAVDLSSVPGIIPTENTNWPRKSDRPRIAGVNSFGISGTDVHILIQEPPHKCRKKRSCTSLHPLVLPLSAHSEVALGQLVEIFQKFCHLSEEQAEDVCYTAGVFRPQHPLRCAVVGTNTEEIGIKLLKKEIISMVGAGAEKLAKRVCYTFPGDMGRVNFALTRELYRSYASFREEVDKCSVTFEKTFPNKFPSFGTLLLSNEEEIPFQQLETQAELQGVLHFGLMITIQISLATLWTKWGVQPDLVLGYSTGEISAAVVSGALNLETAFMLLNVFPLLFPEQGSSKTSILTASAGVNEIQQLLQMFSMESGLSELDVGVDNSDHLSGVVGPSAQISQFKVFCKHRGIACVETSAPFAAHTRRLQSACTKAKHILSQVEYADLKTKWVSSSTGKLVEKSELGPGFWVGVITRRVEFRRSCAVAQEHLLSEGVFLEMGYSDILTNFTQENIHSQSSVACFASLSSNSSGIWTTLGEMYVRGAEVRWSSVYSAAEDFSFRKVKLPGYPFQRKRFWYKPTTQKAPLKLSALEHPLLGNMLSAPLPNLHIFINDWMDHSVRDGDLHFIRDHIIGSTVIVPGAAFMEMFVAACFLTGDKTVRLRNAQFILPLMLDGPVDTRVRCILETKEGTMQITVYSSNSSAWRTHASAEVAPSSVEPSKLTTITTREQLTNLKTAPELDQSSTLNATRFYASYASVGLALGKSFVKIIRLRTGPTVAQLSPVPQDSKLFYHPVLLDAMLQAYVYHITDGFDTPMLYVPVGIEEFEVCADNDNFAQSHSATHGCCYIICDTNGRVTLYSEQDQPVVSMMGIKMAATTTKNMGMAAKGTAKNNLKVYREVWEKSSFYQLDNPGTISVLKASPGSSSSTTKDEHFNTQLAAKIRRMGYLYILKALYELNCVKDRKQKMIENTAEVFPGLQRALAYYIKLVRNEPCPVPELMNVQAEIEELAQEPTVKQYPILELFSHCGTNLANFLRGQTQVHSVLFDKHHGAEHFYQHTIFNQNFSPLKAALEEWVLRIRDACKVVKILEVGAGTGHFSRQIVELLEDMDIKYEYHFTDISKTLVSQAQQTFPAKQRDNINFQVLDVGTDPLEQGFPPEYFDVVWAFQVLHATRCVATALQNIAMLTKPGGRLLMGETEKPIIETDVVFGGLTSYWHFEDNYRSEHCTLQGEQWLDIMTKVGFDDEKRSIVYCDGHCSVITARRNKVRTLTISQKTSNLWLVFRCTTGKGAETFKQYLESTLGRRVTLIPTDSSWTKGQIKELIGSTLENNFVEGIIYWIGSTDTEIKAVLEPLLHLTKFLLEADSKNLPKICLVTCCLWWQAVEDEEPGESGQPNASLAWGFMRTFRQEAPAFQCKSVELGEDKDTITMVRLAATELWVEPQETETVYRNGMRYVRRIRETKLGQLQEMSIPRGEYALQLTSNRIQDVAFVPLEKDANLELKPFNVKVRVHHTALNFRDIMTILQPSSAFSHLRRLGFDFAGVVSEVGRQVKRLKVGDLVFGPTMCATAFGSSVMVTEDLLVPVPSHLTLAEAAALPTVFVTVWLSMVKIAKLQAGQTILLHAASGGCGLMAIQVAKMLGVRVIGTASTPRKRSLVMAQGVAHVFNSRTLDFLPEVLRVTEGHGVDMVLNCLTGAGFKEASLEACKDGGHFVELGRYQIWAEKDVRERRPQVLYNIVNVESLTTREVAEMIATLADLLKKGKIVPLPVQQFEASQL